VTNREFYLQRRSTEATLFEKVFQAVPADQLDWRPEPKARSARELLGHLIGHEQDVVELLERGEINHRMQVPFSGVSQAVDLFREACRTIETTLRATDDDTWDKKTGRFLINGNLVYEVPRRDLSWMLLFDSIHHRGQLSTYLRPMGSRVPSIYGPSADDSGTQ
jgi:uncharacterized damage-inducible protein DinB